MKRQTGGVLVVSVLAAGVSMAATVTVNPPAGTVTNVRAFVTGEDALAVNTGATGSTVHLNPSSSHTGGTTTRILRVAAARCHPFAQIQNL